MKSYLLDTSVVSAFAPGRPPLEPGLVRWFVERDRSTFLSVVTLGEIEEGICKLRRTGAATRAERFEDWFDRLVERFDSRILVLDAPLARGVGRLTDRANALGRNPGLADIVLAATAMEHGLTVLTRNLRHFEPLGVPVLDPLAP